eukprot:gnl/TRDRNA2_/TRDRNA2_91425_c0_seq1.p1 gnl/TRDRNA2_/TRDRNA2_91425_c0~~gnl/TRDRNA2_/TRDRNA2_91425_c0_seq1.p1  ORF type:complete len:435 (+),score=69.89 gnl/TRDRNA2_/TRDRNA2_91425_c0_seq1:820-2124(+)
MGQYGAVWKPQTKSNQDTKSSVHCRKDRSALAGGASRKKPTKPSRNGESVAAWDSEESDKASGSMAVEEDARTFKHVRVTSPRSGADKVPQQVTGIGRFAAVKPKSLRGGELRPPSHGQVLSGEVEEVEPKVDQVSDEKEEPEEPRSSKVSKKRLQPTPKMKPAAAQTVQSPEGTELVPFQGAVATNVMQDRLHMFQELGNFAAGAAFGAMLQQQLQTQQRHLAMPLQIAPVPANPVWHESRPPTQATQVGPPHQPPGPPPAHLLDRPVASTPQAQLEIEDLQAAEPVQLVDVYVDAVKFSQCSILPFFSQTRFGKLSDLVDALDAGTVKPLEDECLILEGFRIDGTDTFISLDNRRLYCFYWHQHHARAAYGEVDGSVAIRMRLFNQDLTVAHLRKLKRNLDDEHGIDFEDVYIREPGAPNTFRASKHRHGHR